MNRLGQGESPGSAKRWRFLTRTLAERFFQEIGEVQLALAGGGGQQFQQEGVEALFLGLFLQQQAQN